MMYNLSGVHKNMGAMRVSPADDDTSWVRGRALEIYGPRYTIDDLDISSQIRHVRVVTATNNDEVV